MKNQALFSSKDKSKKLKCCLQFLFGALRVNIHMASLLICLVTSATSVLDSSLFKFIDCSVVK